MTRAPWNNESRICRWPDGGFGPSGPSKEEKLRKKYPELQKKWEEYIRCVDEFEDADTKANKKRYQKAKKDYEFLKKMLWDY